MEVKNAVIESVTLEKDDRGFLQCWLRLNYGGSGQGFGGYVLYLPKSYSHHELKSIAGHFIFRCMEIAGVERWEHLPGRTIRVRSDLGKVYSIGHIVKDDWFDPAKDFSSEAVAGDESEALRDMLDSARTDLEMLREALGVPAEPHQSLLERMVEAAQAKRGAVPEGWQLVPINCTPEMRAAWDAAPNSDDDDVDFHCGYRAMLAAAPAPDHFRDAAKMVTVHCTPLEHEGQIVYEHTSEPIPNADGFVLYAPVPDQFRNAAKMMAVQPSCMACTAPAPAAVPMPEAVERAMVKVIDTSADVVCASDEWNKENDANFKRLLKRSKDAQEELRATVQQYGYAREAAGYARGRAEAGRDAECQRRLFDVLLGEDGQAWKEAERYLETARPDLFATLRREAKPAKCDGNHGGPRCADPECWNDPVDDIIDVRMAAKRLVKRALAVGVVLTIETQPRQPLAMGNYDLVVETREARKCGAA